VIVIFVSVIVWTWWSEDLGMVCPVGYDIRYYVVCDCDVIILGTIAIIVVFQSFLIFCIRRIIGVRARVALYCMMWWAWKDLSAEVEGIKRGLVGLGCVS